MIIKAGKGVKRKAVHRNINCGREERALVKATQWILW
jgi:hypothetical protein